MAAPQGLGEDGGDYYIPPPKKVRYTDTLGGQAWGQRGAGNVSDDDGSIYFTPGAAEEDVERYRKMGARRESPVWLNTNQSDQTRGLQYGSLGQLGASAAGETGDMRLLGEAASGNTASKAEILGGQMSDRALRGQVAAAGSVRGGPAASAAAYRSAAQGATIQRADMARGIQAERASELDRARTSYSGAMGAARRDYAGAATAVRGQDIGQATTQAQLEAQERAAQRQQEQQYEEMAFRTRAEDLRARQASAGVENQERQWLRTTQNAEKQADWNKTKDVISMGTGAMTGGASAYANVAKAQHDSRETETSDVRAKEPLQWGSLAPVTWGSGATVGATDREDRDDGGNDNHEAPVYDNGMFRDNPYQTTKPTWSTGGVQDPQVYNDGIVHADPYITSDDRAKLRAAYQLGRTHQSTGEEKWSYGGPRKPGEEVKEGPDGDAVAPREMKTFQRHNPEAINREGREFNRAAKEAVYGNAAMLMNPIAGVGHHLASVNHLGGAEAAASEIDGPVRKGSDIPDEEPVKLAPMTEHAPEEKTLAPMIGVRDAPPEEQKPSGGYLQKLRNIFGSDEKTKNVSSADAEMADAARSMKPGVYSYKPEFTPPTQKPGEINIGPMANEMAKDKVASTAIVTNPETGMLAIDKDKGLKLVMGSLASLQHQIDSMGGNDEPRAKGAKRPRRGDSAQP